MLFLNKKAMKEKLLSFLFICLGFNGFGQTTETITIDWSFNSTPSASGNANTNRTIEVGDTVTWNWFSTGNHNVVRNGGTSTDAFDSGTLTGPGSTFSHIFSALGTNTYVCEPHATTMFGTITVVAEGTLNVKIFEDVLAQIDLYPNPASTLLKIDIPRRIEGGVYLEVYDVLGKRIVVKEANNFNNTLNISNWSNGVYLMNISSNTTGKSVTKRFVKI
jgi:hypothetical protein